MEAWRLAFAALILAGLAAPAVAQAYPIRDHRDPEARRVPSYGGAAQHYGAALRRGHRRTAALSVQPGFFYGSGGVGGQPAYTQTYVFYGIPYAGPRPFGAATARPVSQVQVRVDGQ